MARAEAGRHYSVQSIIAPLAGFLGPMHLNHLEACDALTRDTCTRPQIFNCHNLLPPHSITHANK